MYDAAGKGVLVPTYLICEESAAIDGALGGLERGVGALSRLIRSDPLLADVVALGLITFSSSAQVAFRRLRAWDNPPPYELRAAGPSRWGPAFRALASVLPDDVRQLRAEGYKLYRPQAFFLVSLPPQDQDWSQVFRETLTYDKATGTGLRQYPISHTVSVGVGLSDESLRSLAYPSGKGRWMRARDAEDAGRFMIESFRNLITDLPGRCPSVPWITAGSDMSWRGNPL
jgi:hypothetical protein